MKASMKNGIYHEQDVITETAGQEASPLVQMLAMPELDSRNMTPSASAAPIMEPTNVLHHIKTRLTVSVGEAELTVGELLNAHEHQILRLNRKVDQPVDLSLEGKVIARGLLVAAGDNFAVKITELPVSLSV